MNVFDLAVGGGHEILRPLELDRQRVAVDPEIVGEPAGAASEALQERIARIRRHPHQPRGME